MATKGTAPLQPPAEGLDDAHEATPGDQPDPSPVVPSTDTGAEPPEPPEPTPVTPVEQPPADQEWSEAGARLRAFFASTPARVKVPPSTVPRTDTARIAPGEQMVMLQREVEQLRDENLRLRTDLAYARGMIGERLATERATAVAAATDGPIVTPTMPGAPRQVQDAPPTTQP